MVQSLFRNRYIRTIGRYQIQASGDGFSSWDGGIEQGSGIEQGGGGFRGRKTNRASLFG